MLEVYDFNYNFPVLQHSTGHTNVKHRRKGRTGRRKTLDGIQCCVIYSLIMRSRALSSCWLGCCAIVCRR